MPWSCWEFGFCLPPSAGRGAGNRSLPGLLSILCQVAQKQCTNSGVLTVEYLNNMICLLSHKVYEVFQQSCRELSACLQWVGFADLSHAAPSPRNWAEPLSARLALISLQFAQKNIANCVSRVNYFKRGFINTGDFARLALGTHHCPHWGTHTRISRSRERHSYKYTK